jgi:hypothetical protein
MLLGSFRVVSLEPVHDLLLVELGAHVEHEGVHRRQGNANVKLGSADAEAVRPARASNVPEFGRHR